ncbi:MAG: hypothetical protein QOK24_410, partial [Verrucomicrobiota bacterium]
KELCMRTKILIAWLAAGLLMLGQPASAAPKSFKFRQQARQNQRPAILSERTVSGLIPRAIRGGNPLQMLNPFAPAKYGTARENLSVDPDVPGRVNGINFVSISF